MTTRSEGPGDIAMNLHTLQRLIGALLMLSGMWLLPPMAVAFYFDELNEVHPFAIAALIELVLGLAMYWPLRQQKTDLRVRDGFLIVVLAWLLFAISGALPMWLIKQPHIGFVDGLFEAMSALTTTGATVLTGLDDMPRGLLYLRSQMQWLGGMGIVVLAVAILPMLRIGGMQLFRAETPGPMKDAKLTPRITETAKALWLIYLVITVCCAIAYWVAGMSIFDAINHAFTTIPTGGFSTHDSSMGYFDNPLIEFICMIFMFIGTVNFSLHFVSWRNISVQHYFKDSELRVYIALIGLFIFIITLDIYFQGIANSFLASLRLGAFQAVSAISTTGYTTASFYLWPGFTPLLLILISVVGASAGSTGGGIKIIRVLLLAKQALREIRQLIHPNAVLIIKYDGRMVRDSVISAIWGFFFIYSATIVLTGLVLHLIGLDIITAFTATIACITSLGPGLGAAGPNFISLPDSAKLILTLVMLLGRLEIFTLLVLFMPSFWRD